jgi:meso-butanediol dehydrogenase/(S,S)-butanediol dehydrogenase/diacetyl reductase
MSKVAIITGAAQGIGKAIALRLATDGYDIALNDIPAQEQKLSLLAAEIHALGRKTVIVLADVSDEPAVEKMVADTVAALGAVDVMVANAGISQPAPLLLTTAEHWDKHLSVNLRGAFLCFKYAAKQMIAQGGGGRIIGGASLASYSGMPMIGAYSASKGGIRTLTHSAAREWGSHGITVNSYAPGVIVTELTLGSYGEAVLEEQKKSAALGDNGSPEDVAGLVSFLASKDARFITGQTIMIDGGRLCA